MSLAGAKAQSQAHIRNQQSEIINRQSSSGLRLASPAATPASLSQPLQKNQAVIVGFKHHLPAKATGHDMTHRSRIPESQRPRHATLAGPRHEDQPLLQRVIANPAAEFNI